MMLAQSARQKLRAGLRRAERQPDNFTFQRIRPTL